MTETLEHTAQRIADKGRDALLDRLRPAFAEATRAHAGLLDLDAEKVERMVQRAADRADGLQWRRALASVATDELGIGLGEALCHPAVARAQTIVGAPSYEEALAAIAVASPTARAAGDTGAGDAAGRETAAGSATAGGAPGGGATGGGPPGDRAAGGASAGGASATADAAPDSFRILAGVVHVDGLPELEGEGDLELRFTEEGLDVVRESDGAAVARFARSELRSVRVQSGRGRMLRRHATQTRIIVSAAGRRARFDARDADPEDLKQRLALALAKLDAGK